MCVLHRLHIQHRRACSHKANYFVEDRVKEKARRLTILDVSQLSGVKPGDVSATGYEEFSFFSRARFGED